MFDGTHKPLSGFDCVTCGIPLYQEEIDARRCGHCLGDSVISSYEEEA